ncbi:unnamed protein product [Moneuplotes crassus]|uniref:Uncharacterized protein n=1 Tax=Euplotes crassus TaxID=5936 RepID=A0AAD1Y6S2_EUPCR|nr:unnamed protein product [Moneuplotes crassus]
MLLDGLSVLLSAVPFFVNDLVADFEDVGDVEFSFLLIEIYDGVYISSGPFASKLVGNILLGLILERIICAFVQLYGLGRGHCLLTHNSRLIAYNSLLIFTNHFFGSHHSCLLGDHFCFSGYTSVKLCVNLLLSGISGLDGISSTIDRFISSSAFSLVMMILFCFNEALGAPSIGASASFIVSLALCEVLGVQSLH